MRSAKRRGGEGEKWTGGENLTCFARSSRSRSPAAKKGSSGASRRRAAAQNPSSGPAAALAASGGRCSSSMASGFCCIRSIRTSGSARRVRQEGGEARQDSNSSTPQSSVARGGACGAASCPFPFRRKCSVSERADPCVGRAQLVEAHARPERARKPISILQHFASMVVDAVIILNMSFQRRNNSTFEDTHFLCSKVSLKQSNFTEISQESLIKISLIS